MKNNKIYLLVMSSFILLAALALLSCGGGGGGDASAPAETNTALTADNAPQAAAGVLKSSDVISPLSGVTGIITTSSSATGTASTQSTFSNVLTMTASGVQGKANLIASGSIPWWTSHTMTCSEGGTMVIGSGSTWDGPASPSDSSEVINFKGNVTFNSCKKSTLTLHGTVYVSVTGSLTSPTAVTLSGSLNYSDTATSATMTLSSANLSATNIAADYDMSNARIVLSGNLQATIGSETVSVRGDGFTVQLAAVSGGTTASFSGRIRTTCLGTWLTLSTSTPVTILSGDSCPTGGDISATYGGNTIRVEIGSDAGMNLYFNGTSAGTYAGCADLKGQCL